MNASKFEILFAEQFFVDGLFPMVATVEVDAACDSFIGNFDAASFINQVLDQNAACRWVLVLFV